MLVKILGLGCNWWRRYGQDPEDPYRYTRHAAFYNSTGVQCGSKVRRHWVIPGLIRFNGKSNFNPHGLKRCIGETFLCTEPIFAMGGNRVVFQARVAKAEVPDFFLVVLSSDRFGVIDFQSHDWKSGATRPIAASHLRDRQEVMVLMRVGDWVNTDLGCWYLKTVNQLDAGAALQLEESIG